MNLKLINLFFKKNIMQQLIDTLSSRPEIIFWLLLWPFFLWIAKIIIHKIFFKLEKK